MNIPNDIKAEVVLNYFKGYIKNVDLSGMHKRNAYIDVLAVTCTSEGVKCEIARDGIYDILPEALFHPIDRFDNIPANEYKERFAEEYEQQQIEEDNARTFFAPFDNHLICLNQTIEKLKEPGRYDHSIILEILLDRIPDEYTSNRFIKRLLPYIPQCSKIRGDRTLLSLIIRKILFDEGIQLEISEIESTFDDRNPRYNCHIQNSDEDFTDLYLGSSFDESTLEYTVKYWDEDECSGEFHSFVYEVRIFEEFINDFFIGIEANLKFNIITHTLPVRLSEEICYYYLGYNTNL